MRICVFIPQIQKIEHTFRSKEHVMPDELWRNVQGDLDDGVANRLGACLHVQDRVLASQGLDLLPHSTIMHEDTYIIEEREKSSCVFKYEKDSAHDYTQSDNAVRAIKYSQLEKTSRSVCGNGIRRMQKS